MGRVETELAWLAAQARREAHWPVIGIAAEADLETAVRAMKQGAFDFLLEVAHRHLLAAVRRRSAGTPPSGNTSPKCNRSAAA